MLHLKHNRGNKSNKFKADIVPFKRVAGRADSHP